VHEIHVTTISMYTSYLSDIILEVSKSNHFYVDIKTNLQQGMPQQKLEGYEIKEDRILMYMNRVYASNVQQLKSMLLSEMYKVLYERHQGYEKTIATIKKQYYCPCMKKEVVNFIARCPEC
jgi:hypothetical protein